MNNETFTLVVIGCGLTGTSMLYQFVRMIKQQFEKGKQPLKQVRIIVFEKNNNPGPGLPYDSEKILPCHLTNMQTGDMSIVSCLPDDLTDWISACENGLKLKHPELDQWFSEAEKEELVKAHPPRVIIGRYLRERFDQAVQLAKELGISLLVHKKSEVTDIRDHGHKLIITALDLETEEIIRCHADKVLLATGHWFNTIRKPGYFSSPWPAQNLLQKIPEGETVAIIGTSLSAIDAVLTLFSDGSFTGQDSGSLKFLPPANSRSVTMFSRNGLLPKIRGRSGSYRNSFFTMAGLQALMAQKNDGLALEDIFTLLDRELENAYGKPIPWDEIHCPQQDHITILKEGIQQALEGDNPAGDILWQTILFQSLAVIKTTYLNLTPAQKQRFETDFQSIFMAHAAPVSLIIAQKILALLQSGRLKIHRLSHPVELNKVPQQNGFEFHHLDQNGKARTKIFQFVVDARGQSRTYQTNPSTLAKNMLSSELVQIEDHRIDQDRSAKGFLKNQENPYKGRGIWVDPESFGVITGSQAGGLAVSSKLHAVGAMIQGQIVNASMAHESVASTYRIAGQIIDELYNSPG
jgi:uncharacterized NAD(P)/FAD-binding protein YdhS